MVVRGTSRTFDRQQRQARISEATEAITSIEEALGTAVLEGDEAHQGALRDERAHLLDVISDQRAAIAVLDRKIADENTIIRAQAVERQQLELYECYAKLMPIRANMLRRHKDFLGAQREHQEYIVSSRLEHVRRSLVKAQIEYEHPTGPLGDGGNDPEQVEADAGRFRKLADEIRAKLGG